MGKTGIQEPLSDSHELVVKSGNLRKKALKEIKMHFSCLFEKNVHPGRMCGSSHLPMLSLNTRDS